MFIYAYMHTHIHLYMYTCMNTHVHIYIQLNVYNLDTARKGPVLKYPPFFASNNGTDTRPLAASLRLCVAL